MKSILLFFSLLLLSPALLTQIQSSSVGGDDYSCVYMVYIRTGSIFKGGTDSIISLTLNDNRGGTVQISNLEAWGGLMGPGHDYFERGNLDIFSGRGPCLGAPICAMNLTSDGSGPHHGWYCNYVEVTTTGPHVPCRQQLFTVEQWIARDAPPYELTAIRDKCAAAAGVVQDHQDKNAYHSTISF
ncbi:PLAT domain-containing protein 3-like protein [Cinnamomum micranthum f. kanehirae]|uniref:PLAT domain-containing protein 3-like protein n=1 Tax=Cinnamomum micranthum f. kanehirae TaxID=337451 RepID=A0A443PGJ6_9MAGN|nr:PLAT domain-containing protein 3-like protein [Cinnamomum micranthum f. kanehirae]